MKDIEKEKKRIAKEIGEYFGEIEEKNGIFYVDTYDGVKQFNSLDYYFMHILEELITKSHGLSRSKFYNWEEEIKFIYKNVLKREPQGVTAIGGLFSVKWESSIDIDVCEKGKRNVKRLSLGVYPSFVDAIYYRQKFFKYLLNESCFSLEKLEKKANEMVKEANNREKEQEIKRNCTISINGFNHVYFEYVPKEDMECPTM